MDSGKSGLLSLHHQGISARAKSPTPALAGLGDRA